MIKKYCLVVSLLFFGITVFAQNLDINIVAPNTVCNPGDCTNLQVNYSNLKETTSYQVNSIPYNPPFATTSGSSISLNLDDQWSDVIDLKGLTFPDFNFCFYGQTYNKVLISTNGVITFSVAGQTPNGFYSPSSFSTWIMGGAVPYAGNASQAPFRNSINGVFQDSNPSVSNSFAHPNINYYTAGVYPNRAFVVNFSQLAQYGCSSDAGVGAQTSQMVIYETSNNIEVYVQRRVPCTAWNSGNGFIGIQNNDGTIGSVPPGRNVGTWSAANEAWRFTPNGNTITPNITWMQNGNVIGNSATVNVCPLSTEQYTAIVSYPSCNTTVTTDISDSITVGLESMNFQEPVDLQACAESLGTVNFNLTSNESVMLGAQSPSNYTITYHTSFSDANTGNNPIANPQIYSSAGNQTIFVKIENLLNGCVSIKSFALIVNTRPGAPTGNSDQDFITGETIADIEVTGTNISWYGSATGSDLLPNSTLLVDGATYYASQTNAFNCESRTLPSRLGVTVHNTLGSQNFIESNFKAYPNPVKNILNLSYSKEITTVEIFNMLGQKVLIINLNTTQGQIDMSNLNSGNYIVKVTVDGLLKTIKVFKQ